MTESGKTTINPLKSGNLMSGIMAASRFIALESALLLLLIIFWSANKGFDFTDEAYYFLSISQPESSNALFYYQHILSFLFGWMNMGITGMRILRLLLTILVALVLALGMRTFMNSHHNRNEGLLSSNSIHSFAIAFILLATGYSIYPQLPSYNNFTLLALGGFTAVLLLEQAAIRISKASAYVKLPFIMGIMISLVFCGKFTTGILLFIATVAYIFASIQLAGYGIRAVSKALTSLIFGIVVFLCFSSIFIKSFPEWIGKFSKALQAVEGHSASGLLTTYTDSLSYFCSALADRFVILPLAFLLWFVFSKKMLPSGSSGKTIHYAVFLILYALLVKKIYDEELWKSGVEGYQRALFFPALLALCIPGLLLSGKSFEALRLKRGEIIRLLPFLSLLFLLPLTAVAGSDNVPHIQCIQFSFSWLLLLLMALQFAFKFTEKLPAILFTILLLTVTSIQVVHGLTQSPYRLIGPISLQNNPVSLPGVGKFMTDDLTYGDINSFNEIAKGSELREGDGLLVFGAIPGFVSIAGARVVASAWLKTDQAGAACSSISELAPGKSGKVFVMLPRHSELPAEIRECLARVGINFPEDYYLKSATRYSIFNYDFDFYVPR